MLLTNLTQKHSNSEAWLHDYLSADRSVSLHAYFFEHGNLVDVLAKEIARSLLDVGCGVGNQPSA